MRPSIQYVNPNPHTTYEVRVAHLPRWVTLLFALLAAVALVGTVALYAKYEPSILQIPKVQPPSMQNVHAAIQQRVDKALSPEVK